MNTDQNTLRNIRATSKFTLEQAMQLGYVTKRAPIGYFATVGGQKIDLDLPIEVRINTGEVLPQAFVAQTTN